MEHNSSRKKQKPTDVDEFDDYVEYNSDNEESGPNIVINDNYPQDEFEARDYRMLTVKDDHWNRPIWVSPDGCIYFETFNKLRKITQEFLITIAEPVSRPEHVHTYKLTDTSLYAAVSGGLKSEEIVKYLETLSKNALPDNITAFIRTSTSHYGKANLVLLHGRLKIESKSRDHLRSLIADPKLKQWLVQDEHNNPIISTHTDDARPQKMDPFLSEIDRNECDLAPDIVEFYKEIDKVVEENTAATDSNIELWKNEQIAYSLQIKEEYLENVKKRCIDLKSTLLVEYDFRNDHHNPDIRMDLKPTTTLRPYQEKSLRKMFGHNRARSGIIVLPCGAGKTLVGVTAACTIRKRCIVFCTGGVAVEQWRNHFTNYTTIEEKKICRFTGSTKDPWKSTDVFITTYNIIGYSGKRSYETKETLNWVKEQEWGLILLDEVHTIPAKTFRSVLQVVHGHCMLGLTATLVREDNKINDLNFLVGPKLYEADWMELQEKGFIARVQCIEVRCTMTPEFYAEYLKAPQYRQMLLYVMNPEKIRRCEYLIRYHEKRGDKIIVFSDNLYALEYYATQMGQLFLKGETSHEERISVMENFKQNPKVNTIFVSKLADVALDLPEATVLIQISSQGASRRQEAQRLGRITRAKKGMRPDEVNAFFYTLISSDTTEQQFSVKRQQFLKNQGYAFKVVTELDGMNKEELQLSTKASQLELLGKVLKAQEKDCSVEGIKLVKPLAVPKPISRSEAISNSISKKRKLHLAGGDGPVYMDTGAPSNRH